MKMANAPALIGHRDQHGEELKEAFWVDFCDAWKAHGQAALSLVAQEDPGTFVKVAASIMPKETELTMREVAAKDLSDDALAAIAVGGD